MRRSPEGSGRSRTAMAAILSKALALQAGRLLTAPSGQQWCRALSHSTASMATSQADQQASTSASSATQSSEGLFIVPLPKLSHTMTKGKLVKWHKQPGDKVNVYDVLFEVATDELTEPEFRVGDFEGTVTLLVEAHEEGWLAGTWQQADDTTELQVGTPVGVVCEDETMLQAAQAYQCPTTNIYDEKQRQVPVLTWQSFLKTGKQQVKCMG